MVMKLDRPGSSGLALSAKRLQRDAGFGREAAVIAVDRDDIVIFGDRPIGTEWAFRRQVHGIFRPQPFEIPPHLIGLKQGRLRGIERFERRGIGNCVATTTMAG
jgi:hypothetical protein